MKTIPTRWIPIQISMIDVEMLGLKEAYLISILTSKLAIGTYKIDGHWTAMTYDEWSYQSSMSLSSVKRILKKLKDKKIIQFKKDITDFVHRNWYTINQPLLDDMRKDFLKAKRRFN